MISYICIIFKCVMLELENVILPEITHVPPLTYQNI